jgi:hypothetical protein
MKQPKATHPEKLKGFRVVAFEYEYSIAAPKDGGVSRFKTTEMEASFEIWRHEDDHKWHVRQLVWRPEVGFSRVVFTDRSGKFLREEIRVPNSPEQCQKMFLSFKQRYFLGRSFPSEKEIKQSLRQQKATHPDHYCGRKVYIAKNLSGYQFWHDARTGIPLREQSKYKGKWEDIRQLRYARWTLSNGHEKRIYEIRCRTSGKWMNAKVPIRLIER